jgi:hypothetical protein
MSGGEAAADGRLTGRVASEALKLGISSAYRNKKKTKIMLKT